MTRPSTDQLPARELLQLRDYLLRQGVTVGEIVSAVGTSPAGRTRAQIAEAVRSWLRVKHRSA